MTRVALLLIAIVAVGGWLLTRPQTISSQALPAHTPDVASGERAFWAGGCATCHATPVDGRRAKGDNRLLLGGGMELDTEFGVFRVPNISPHESDGIGSWSALDFVNAMQRGVAPDGRHYYPAFPYTSYARMDVAHVLDLFAYIATLEPIASPRLDHDLSFPWSVRTGIGLWKHRYLDPDPVMVIAASNPLLERGRMLVEGAGHCGECHSPRDAFGGIDTSRWLAGAPSLEGKGRVPGITPQDEDFGEWSAGDIAYYLETGFTPDFDVVGGSMVAVQENMAMLDAEDRNAIAAYLKSLGGGN